ncbi:UNVERIFIED_CONTAM: hypothetical protein PYX00_007506 [Menopon gallinae]|uniref:Uncharacterized protein n=1 Tax=Menopon gallinae TaxID=328185 RepID=A0AAW2HJ11_9NEOP
MNFVAPLLLLSLTVTSSSITSSVVIEVMANVTLLLSEEHSTRCIQIFRSDDMSDSEREHVYNLWRVLAVPQSHTTTGIYSFNRYVTRKLGKPWKVSCYKPLKVLLQNTGSKLGYAQLTHQLRVKDSIWLIFLDDDIEGFFSEANLLFDCQVIVANVRTEDMVILYEVYRVRKDYPLRYDYYGKWTRDGGLDVAKDTLYDRRSNLEGLVLKAGSVINWPTTWLQGSKWVGFLPKIWSEIEELTNSSTEYYESVDGMTGLKNANGTWNGLVGMTVRGEIDVIVSEITIEKSRSHVLDLFHPLIYSSYRLYFRQEGYNLQWDTVFRPFGKSIWFAVVLWLFLGSAVISVCYYISFIYGIEKDQDKISTPTRSFFFILQTLSQQGYHAVPSSASCRMLFFLSYLLSAILIPSYSASLISYLTQQVPYRPFNDLEMLYADGRYRLLIKENTAEYGYFKHAKNDLLKSLFKYNVQTVPKEFEIQNSSHAFKIICTYPYYAFFGIDIIMSIRLSTVLKPDCPILTTTTPISYIYLTMGAVKNSPYSGLINYHIIKMISFGIAKRIENLEFPRINKEPQTSLREVALGEVFQMFVLIGVSVVVSIGILLVEKRVYKMKQSKEVKNKRSNKVSHWWGNAISKPVSLVIMNTTMETFFENVSLPYNLITMGVEILSPDFLEIHEVFRVDSDFPMRIHRVGNWTPKDGIYVNPRTMFSRRYDFEGKVLRTGSIEKWPFSTFNGYLDKNQMWDGFYCAVWSELGRLLNFKSEHYRDEYIGIKGKDKKWNGLIKRLLKNEVDVIVADISITKPRLKVLDFTYPLISSWYQIYYRQPGYRLRWYAIFEPFNYDVWVAILIWTAAATICFYVSYHLCLVHGLEEKDGQEFGLMESFFFMIRTLSFQDYNSVPGTVVCRTIFLMAYVAAAVLIPAYSASLISFLTQHSPVRPFDSLEGLLQDGTYKLLLERNTSEYSYFARASDKTLRNIHQKLVVPIPMIHYSNFSSYGLEMLCKHDKLALFDVQQVIKMKNTAALSCELLSLTQSLTKVDEGMAFAKGNPYAIYIHHQMTEAGLIRRIRKRVSPNARKNFPPWKPVKVEEVFQIFSFLVIGMGVSVVILIVEKTVAAVQARMHAKSCRNERFVESFVLPDYIM